MKTIILIFSLLIFGLLLTVNSNGQTTDSSNSSENQTKKPESDKPLKIKRKPQARFTQGACSESSGLVSLRVTFDKSAKITDVEMISSSGCDKFDKDAVTAAKGIKFNPAVKNGEPVTVVKIVQYTFRY